MPSEEFFSSICGPPLAANTAVSKDIGIYNHTLSPAYGVKSTFKKSSSPRHCLAVSDTHIFAAQDQKAHVHVYSRARGNQEALVPFAERIRSLALSGNVLVVGTCEGRLILWETCTGRLLTTPPCHVQAISCIAVTRHHILSASEDSNINVWSLARLLEADALTEAEPELVLSNHRGAITDIVAGPSSSREASLCVSASRDKTCIVWNYRTGQVLRTLLFPDIPICAQLDPCAHAIFVMCEGRALFLVELFGDKPLLGSRSEEPASIVVQVKEPLAVASEEVGSPSCLAVSYDGTTLLSGHAKGRILRWNLAANVNPDELANLNASVTNLIFAPLISQEKKVVPVTVSKPLQSKRPTAFNAQLQSNLDRESRFSSMVNAKGFTPDVIEEAMLAFTNPASAERNNWG